MAPQKNLVLHDFARYFFVLAVVAVLVLFAWIISPFFNTLVYAAAIVIVFYPVHEWFLRRLRHRGSAAAFFSTLFVILVVLIPVILFGFFLTQEAVSAYQLFSVKIATVHFNTMQWDSLYELPWIGPILLKWATYFGFSDFVYSSNLDILGWAKSLVETLSGFLVTQSATILGAVGNTVMKFFVLLLTIFFFFRDGMRFVALLGHLSPLPSRYETEIGYKLRDTTYAIVMGTFVTALVQGLAGGLGFAIVGMDNLVFWASLMAFASLIPYVGAALVWGPVALAFFIQGDALWGVFMVLWGLLVVGLIDNIVRPMLIGSRTQMNSFLTFLAVIGGILIFGFKGIIFGPFILSLTVTILHIYQLEYKEVLKA